MVSVTRTVPITQRALIQRINRALKDNDESLKKTRGAAMELECGEYYILSFRNVVMNKHVDPEELGRSLGVLKPHERVVEG